MPDSFTAPVSRRRFVAVTAVATGMALAGGCALPPADDEPDPLLALAVAAARDARELAAADASHGDDAPRLRRIADARRIHAERLSAEIGAAEIDAAEVEPGDTAEPIDTADVPGAGSPAVCPPIGEVRERLREDARRAGEVAVDSRGYRSELAASVSAACTTAVEVVLA